MLSIMILVSPLFCAYFEVYSQTVNIGNPAAVFQLYLPPVEDRTGSVFGSVTFPFSPNQIFLIGSYMATSLYSKFETCDQLAANLVPLFVFLSPRR